MTSDFDRIINRRDSDSVKWRRYAADVLPLWVADMDFAAPAPVLAALTARVAHGVLGYGIEPPALRPAVTAWLQERFDWCVPPDALIFLPGVISGFNVACRGLAAPGDGVLVQPPVYSPILDAPAHHGLIRQEAEPAAVPAGYAPDPAALEAALTPRTRLLLFCNPQNPTGRVFTRGELAQVADLCLRRRLVIVSDEIHCDLVYPGSRHIPIASLSPEVAAATITLIAPSKTFNIPGLYCSVAIITDAKLRRRFEAARRGLVPDVNILGLTAALAAYAEGAAWLDECLCYLQENRDYLAAAVAERLPGIGFRPPEGTYLAWLDCRAAVTGPPGRFFLQKARVALAEGADYGRGGEGFARLNFGCPRRVLQEAVQRMARALEQRDRPG